MDESPWSRLQSEVYAFFGRNPKSNLVVASIAELDASHKVLDIGCGLGAAVRSAAAPFCGLWSAKMADQNPGFTLQREEWVCELL